MAELSVESVLERKRDGAELSAEELAWVVGGVTDGGITRAQAAAFLAFVFLRGMTDERPWP